MSEHQSILNLIGKLEERREGFFPFQYCRESKSRPYDHACQKWGTSRLCAGSRCSRMSRYIFRKPLDGTPKATKATAKIDAPTMGVKTWVSKRTARIKQVPIKNIPAFFLFMKPP